MTDELQEAYNEWLLKYGYREVSIEQANIDRVYYLINVLHNYMPNDIIKRLHIPGKITYQLKTTEELQND